jgi:hypothetical protein
MRLAVFWECIERVRFYSAAEKFGMGEEKRYPFDKLRAGLSGAKARRTLNPLRAD